MGEALYNTPREVSAELAYEVSRQLTREVGSVRQAVEARLYLLTTELAFIAEVCDGLWDGALVTDTVSRIIGEEIHRLCEIK